jgi:DNA primase
MQSENLSFREAVEHLAQRAGLEIPVETREERERQERAATLYDVCEAACVFFQQQLHTLSGAKGAEYLQRRGLDEAAIAKYRLGWAPDSRDSLKRALKTKFSEDLLVAAGLIRKSERGGDTYDFFRGRVIFPIPNRQGKVIAFGARTLGDEQPKYLNSPDTPIFDKGRNLYGQFWAREAEKSDSPTVIVEGYMDVISLQLAGFPRAVAPLGTALTEVQLLELWKMSSEPVVCFDGDAAGQRAAIRALDMALPRLKSESTLNFAILPPKDDPDSYVRNNGKANFDALLKTSHSISEYLWLIATGGKEPRYYDSPEKVLRLESRIRSHTDKIASRNIQVRYEQHFSRKISDLYYQIRQQKLRAKFTHKQSASDAVLMRSAPLRSAGAEMQRRHIQMTLIALAIYRPQIALAEIESLSSFDFQDDDLNAVWQAVLEEIWGKREPNPDEDLVLVVSERLGSAFLDRVLHSNFIEAQRSVMHGDDTELARAVWDATVAKSRLPKCREDLEEAVGRWMMSETVEDEERAAIFRDLVREMETEEISAEALWNRLGGASAGATIH